MSEQLVEELAKSKEVYVTQDDIEAIERFFTHFKFTISKEFNDARTAYLANKTLDTQRMYRFQLAKEIGRIKGQNELVDDLFKNVMETSDKLSFDMSFEEDLEAIVGVDPTTDQAASKP
jgi:hypothetical protein